VINSSYRSFFASQVTNICYDNSELALLARPDAVDAISGLGRAFEMLRDLDQAASYVERAIASEESSAA